MTADQPRGPTATELHARVLAHAAIVLLWTRKHDGRMPLTFRIRTEPPR